MKRMLAVFLVFVCLISLTACRYDQFDGQADASTSPGVVLDETKPSEDVTEQLEDVTGPSEDVVAPSQKPEFAYNMASFHTQIQNNTTTLWFVVEFKEVGYRASPMKPFEVLHKATNKILPDVNVYVGYVCCSEHSLDFSDSDIGADRMQYVVSVKSNGDLAFDDLVVRCNLVYGYMSDGCVDLTFNAGIDEIMIDKGRVHGNAVYRQDDSYYVNDTDIVLHGAVTEKSELIYAMAPVHRDLEAVDGCTKLWFAIVLKPLGYVVNPDDMFVITNKLTGDSLPKVIDCETTGFMVYEGNVCSENHSDDFVSDTGLDYKQYTVCVVCPGDISFDDLSVVANVGCDGNYEPVALEFNGHVSDVTTYQAYVHGNTLFELDGKYYIHSGKTGMYLGDNCAGEFYDIVCINGSLSDLVTSLSGNVTFVYGPTQTDCFADVNVPLGCEMYIADKLSLVVGYRAIDGYVLSDLNLDNILIVNMKYNFDDGRSMVLVAP